MNKNKKRYDKYKKFDVVYADFGRNPRIFYYHKQKRWNISNI